MTTNIRYVMVIDLNKCVGCHSCTIACKSENNVPLTVFRAWVKHIEKGKYPDVSHHFLPRLCNHCKKPPCVTVCPVKAAYKREDGTVLTDYKKCIGCKYCIVACPYDARFINPVRKTSDKCTFCIHRVEKGLMPACVDTCMGRARFFGDLNDHKSEVSRLIAKNPTQTLKPELGTEPSVFYIKPDEAIMGGLKKELE